MDNKVLTYPQLSLFLSEIKKIFSTKTHVHNDLYFTQSEVESQLSQKASLDDLTLHANNDIVHITDSERTKWNKAESNQNAFANVVVGATTIAADSKTDSLNIASGSNIQIVADKTNDKITISATDTKYTHPTTAGNKHIPSGGKSGQFLKWSSDGTAIWASDNNTTYTNMIGATETVDGKSGLVPAPQIGNANRYLRSDGTWSVPPDTKSTLVSLGITATATELNYSDGLTQNIQKQLNDKASKIHNHMQSSTTEPTNQNVGDVWFIEDK